MYILFPVHFWEDLQHYVLRMMPEQMLWMLYAYFSDVRALVDVNPLKYFSLDNRSCPPYRIMSECIYEGYIFRSERRRLIKYSISTMTGAIYAELNRVVQKLLDSNQRNKKYVHQRMLTAAVKACNEEALQMIIQHPSTQARLETDPKFKKMINIYKNVKFINGKVDWGDESDEESDEE
jgi:hypothetical protein